MNTMSQTGYTARIEFDERDNIFVGRVRSLAAEAQRRALRVRAE